ncbi:transposase [Moorena sp. SIO4A5]|uniref:transposase n=1 Tax=Moorena sp. SIO4A5 TaxID=2607838 RepID=UPI0013CDB85A|nr:transposase [Moorena sp. SIO4A5]NEO23857.1 hypothetical protein [Moorena sp. SIO4A5]
MQRGLGGFPHERLHQDTADAYIKKLIEQAGCELLFLPAYSPDLNKIEKFWSRLKHHLRKTIEEFDCLQDALDNAFRVLS